MAWPFSHVVAPNGDSLFTSVPTSATTVDSSTLWLIGAHFCNPTTDPITVSVTDSSSNKIIDSKLIAAHDVWTYAFTFLPCTGLKWSANTSGLIGKLWWYE